MPGSSSPEISFFGILSELICLRYSKSLSGFSISSITFSSDFSFISCSRSMYERFRIFNICSIRGESSSSRVCWTSICWFNPRLFIGVIIVNYHSIVKQEGGVDFTLYVI